MKARRLQIAAIVLLAFGVLAGCSGGDPAGGGTDTSKQIDASAKPTGPKPGVHAGGGGGTAGGAAAQ
jgi:hypothetical protein